jgi:glycosidase
VPSRVRRPVRHVEDIGIHGVPGDVSPWDVRFDPTDVAFCEPLGDGRYRFRVWTEPELASASLVVRDDGLVTEWPLEPIKTRRFTIWEAIVGPLDDDAEYSLAFLTRLGRPVYSTPDGISVAVERLDRWRLPTPRLIDVPEWATGAVMYQIFPERFANGDPSNDPEGAVAWGTEPEPVQFQGGDLQGITGRLDHLEWLGVEVIYLNPVFTSPSNHKYDTIDYYSVDPAFGGDEALRALVVAAHQRNIRVILDASFNHVHPRFFAFADVIEHGAESVYADWFVVNSWPLSIGVREHLMGSDHPMRRWLDRWPSETGLPTVALEGDGRPVEPSYEAWYGVATMPRLDLSNPAARAYALDVARYWVREFDVDGWRMDVARYVDPDFWNDFRKAVREEDPEAYLIAEIMGDAGAWLQGDRFDATMDYTFRSLCLRFLATDEIDGVEFQDEAARSIFQYAWPVTLVCQSLIGSHDTPRFLTEADGEAWRLRLATVLQMTMPGMPGIYYGDELEMAGGSDPGCRGAFPSDIEASEVSNAVAIHELAAVRRRRPELVDGDWRPVGAGDEFVAFERIGGQRTLVMVNRSTSPVTLSTDRAWAGVEFGNGRVEPNSVTVAPRSAIVVSGS